MPKQDWWSRRRIGQTEQERERNQVVPSERLLLQRRALLRGLTGGLPLLAGCSSLSSDDSTTPQPSTTTPPTTTQPAATAHTDAGPPPSSPFTRGEVVADFEGDVRSRWEVLAGTVSVDKQDPYHGTQSLTVQATNKKGYTKGGIPMKAGLIRWFDERGGLDLRNHDLSIAIKFERHTGGRVFVDFLAPTSENFIGSRHAIPIFFNDWTRIDLGYTGKSDDPVMKSVRALRLMVQSDYKTPPTITIDDIRKHPKPDTGKVMLLFDSHPETYTEVFPQLKQRNWQGGVVAVPPSTHKPDQLSTEQMRTMRDAGWDMIASPPKPEEGSFNESSVKKQERRIRQAKASLERKGFPQGARHIVAPYVVSEQTMELIQQYHETCYRVGQAPNNAKHPSNMYDLSYVSGEGMFPVSFYLAAEFNQLLTLSYLTPGTAIDLFEKALTTIEKLDLDVVSPSQFLDSIGP